MVVEYEGIKIANCCTEQYENVPVYDETGTKILYRQIKLSVTGELYET